MAPMKISTRLYLLCGLGVVAVVLMALVSGLLLAKIRDNSTDMLDNAVPAMQNLNHAQEVFLRLRMSVYQHLVQREPAGKDKVEANFNSLRSELAQIFESHLNRYGNPADVRQARDEIDRYLTQVQEIFKYSKNGQYDEVPAATSRVAIQGEKAITAMKQAVDNNQRQLEQARQGVSGAIATGQTTSLITPLVAAALLFVLGTLIVRSVTGPLEQLRDSVVRLASDYDFTRRVPARGGDEVNQTLHAFNQLLDAMQQSFRQLQQVGSGLGASATELADASTQMSAASNDVSESTANMAAAVEEMTVSVTHVADRAGGADDLAREAGRLAGSGGVVIEQTIAKINGIAATVSTAATQIESLKDRTAEISAVVNVIKDIADQTNLLALNAAIEAARAGETGRGFAVVADEVRKLAERTAVSTQEIAGTVQAIQSEAGQTVTSMQAVVNLVGDGVAQAEQAGAAIRQIRTGSDDVVHQVSEISGAMREQSQASTSIAQQIERVAQMSEESNATAMHTAAAADHLQQMSQQLQAAISRYRV
ncbi:methyl-accepting chemotaxis protein [Jeongeupia naejangsanensis]|uniref:Methyl-accepting chemotaxis protein n=1 Tax=Jeongeupia naejangsanensis TaxID=613195 RepID=A0ABS2BKM8_9NEIS|nr:methyl-accepting chemotaxis protein [Jeongeupia naejangsanensis]MBM3116174.1 methyl-accepting chemotaxis protein [Jeongeupia naejangsanensis]